MSYYEDYTNKSSYVKTSKSNKGNMVTHRVKICCNKKSKTTEKIVKAVFPLSLVPGEEPQELETIITNDTVYRYITSDGLQSYDLSEMVITYLNLPQIKSIDKIDHIAVDLHLRSPITQDITFNMYLGQVIKTRENTVEATIEIQSQKYSYQGHKYTLRANEWTAIGERWDKPSQLSLLQANNLPAGSSTSNPKLQINFAGVKDGLALEVDPTLQIHIEYDE